MRHLLLVAVLAFFAPKSGLAQPRAPRAQKTEDCRQKTMALLRELATSWHADLGGCTAFRDVIADAKSTATIYRLYLSFSPADAYEFKWRLAELSAWIADRFQRRGSVEAKGQWLAAAAAYRAVTTHQRSGHHHRKARAFQALCRLKAKPIGGK